jgi:acyl-coenzyme A thioesterase 13
MATQSEEVRRAVAERIRKLEGSGFHKTCGFRVIDYADGRARVELDVTPSLQNPTTMLHGGATASLIDHAGTCAILSADREGRPGVTTDLNVTYFAPGLPGSTVVAHAEVLKIGKHLAFVTVDVRRKDDGALLAQGRMTKFQG